MASGQLNLLGPTPNAEQSQWFTPDWLAERVVEWAHVYPGMRVVELGAGDGAFVRPLLAAGAAVLAVERDPRFVAALHKIPVPSGSGLGIGHGDVLALALPAFDSFRADAYIGNPPYENDADIAFVESGLELAPRVVAVLRLVFLAGQERYRRIWSKHHLSRIAYLPARPSFIGEYTGKAEGARADFAVFDIRRGPIIGVASVATEWWTR